MKKRLLSLLLALTLVCSLLVFPANAAGEVDENDQMLGENRESINMLFNFNNMVLSGSCGKNGGTNVKYEIYRLDREQVESFMNSNGDSINLDPENNEYYAVKIIGTGEMEDYTITVQSPWTGKKELDSDSVTVDLSKQLVAACIDSGVISIGYRAFSDCSSLTSVTIPASVIDIGNYAFSSCNSLTNVTIPEGVTDVGSFAFSDCSSLTDLTVPAGVNRIGVSAFQRCSSLTSVSIPDDVTSIGSAAFSDCSSLTSVTIPKNVAIIGNNTFYNCGNLKSVIIPQGVMSIGYNAFMNCSSLQSVTIPESVTSIKSEAFVGCVSLTSVTIPDKVTSVDHGVFYNCKGLANVTIPVSVTSIDVSAFSGCTSLTDVYYGGTEEQWNTMSIGTNNDPLTAATIHYTDPQPAVIGSGTCGENVTWVLTDDGVLTISGTGPMEDYSYNNRAPWYGNRTKIVTAVIETGVTRIGAEAFGYCRSLTSVKIPESVTSIGGDAFYECSKLAEIIVAEENSIYQSDQGVLLNKEGTQIVFFPRGKAGSYAIPEGVTSIGSSAFSGCGSLTSVTIPDSVTNIGEWAFIDCSSLTSVTIPDSVTSIGARAFSGCSSLTSVTIPDSVTSIEWGAFSGCSSLTDVSIPDSVTSIGSDAFSGCSSLNAVTIPYGVTRIEDYAFSRCSNLTDLTIPDRVTSIGRYAFSGCTSLEKLYFTGKYISIHDSAFQGCTKLKSIQFPFELSLGANAFDGCSALTSITIPYITTIPEYAFQNCTGLESLTIESGVKTIDNYAFHGCSALKTVTLPDSLTNVNTGAFRNCNSIANVYYGGNSTQWSEIAIKSYNEPLTGANIHYSGSAPAKIETDPADAAAPVDTDVNFTVAASGDIASYQWQVKTPSGSWKNSNATGCKTATLEITATAARNGYKYRCIVTGVDGNSVTSEPATLTVAKPVVITGSPMDSVGKAGQIAAFAVWAEGAGLTYQWQYSDNGGQSWKNSSVKAAIYSTKMTAARNGRMVRCVVTDQFGNTATSDTAVMLIKQPLVITSLPKDYVGKAGSIATFSVLAQGRGLTYQWQISDDGSTWANSSVKAASYSTKLTTAKNGRMVRCIVTDANGNSVTSSAARMTIG